MLTKNGQTQQSMYAGLKITRLNVFVITIPAELKRDFRKTWSIALCGQPELITAEGPLGMSIKTCIEV